MFNNETINTLYSYRKIVSLVVLITFLNSLIVPVIWASQQMPNVTRDHSVRNRLQPNQKKGRNLLDKTVSLSPQYEIKNNNINDSLFQFRKGVFSRSNKYKAYFEIGGAKYFNQKSNVAGIYNLFIPLLQTDDSLLFTDLRIFDRSGSSFEGNVHIGYRRLLAGKEQMFGVYGAFDRKRSENQNLFSQLTLGLEYWNNNWFVGGNIYKPIGQSKKVFREEYDEDKSLDRNIVVNKYYEKELPGIDGEFGYSFTNNLTGYVGGYYFKAKDVATVAGPKARITYNYNKENGRILGVLDGVGVEIGAQHDKPRGSTAYIGIKFKLGLTDLGKNSNISGFERHMVDLVRRDPDIVIGKSTKPEQKFYQSGKYGFQEGDQSKNSEDFKQESESLESLLEKFGLPKDASWSDIKKKYREYTLRYHPDKNPNGQDQFIYYRDLYEEISKKFEGPKGNTKYSQQYSQSRQPNEDDYSEQNEATKEEPEVVATLFSIVVQETTKASDLCVTDTQPGDVIQYNNKTIIINGAGPENRLIVEDSTLTDPMVMMGMPNVVEQIQNQINNQTESVYSSALGVIKKTFAAPINFIGSVIDEVLYALIPIRGVDAQETSDYFIPDQTENDIDVSIETQEIPSVNESFGIEELIKVLSPEETIDSEDTVIDPEPDNESGEIYSEEKLITLLKNFDRDPSELTEHQINILEQTLKQRSAEYCAQVFELIVRILTDNVTRYTEDPSRLNFLIELAKRNNGLTETIISRFSEIVYSTKKWRDVKVIHDFASLLPLDTKDNKLVRALFYANQIHGYIAHIDPLLHFENLLDDKKLKDGFSIDNKFIGEAIIISRFQRKNYRN